MEIEPPVTLNLSQSMSPICESLVHVYEIEVRDLHAGPVEGDRRGVGRTHEELARRVEGGKRVTADEAEHVEAVRLGFVLTHEEQRASTVGER